MEETLHNDMIELKYLNQMRGLVLRITSNLDCTIFLFGSRARGVHRRSSDFDIGFSGLSEQEFTKARDRLLSELEESVIPHHVDLVNIDMVPSSFREVVMKEVIIWKQSSRAN
jgi:predicted nucleotidyltransferase